MKSLKEVVSMAMFETQNGYASRDAAIGTVEAYVNAEYIRLGNIDLSGIVHMPVEYITAMSDALGICFPVHDGAPIVKDN